MYTNCNILSAHQIELQWKEKKCFFKLKCKMKNKTMKKMSLDTFKMHYMENCMINFCKKKKQGRELNYHCQV